MHHLTIEHRGIRVAVHLFDVGNGSIAASIFIDHDGFLPKGRHAVLPGSSPTLPEAKEDVVPRVINMIDKALDK